MTQTAIKPYQNDPCVGHLSTPVSDSAWVRNYLSKLPIYRPTLTPLQRGLEIGAAHGFFLIGPFAKLGPLRNSEFSNLAALGSAIALVFIAKAGMRLYGIAVFPKHQRASEKSGNALETYQGWADLSKGFMKGGAVGALAAFVLLEVVRLFGSL